MGKRSVTDFYIYRWRYVLGFAVIAALSLLLLYVVGFHIPGGISTAEMRSTVTSDHTPLAVLAGDEGQYVVDLPYHLLQKLSISTFCVSTVSLKLPSLILALASIGALYGLLRLWFRRNVAVIASVIAISSGEFLLQAQNGTPDIGYIFWNVVLLFSASMLARANTWRPFWLIITALFGALSLYSPLEVYIVLALLATCIIHPHARFLVFRQPIWAYLVSAVVFVGLLLPLIFTCVNDPALIRHFFGVPDNFDQLSWAHARELVRQYLGFTNTSEGALLTPAYGLGTVALAALGLVRLFSAKYTAKSYILTIWAVLLVPIIIFQNSAVSFTFIPLILLVAFALNYLIRSWYRLFPQNPYARVAGLLPLAVLVIGLVVSDVEQFVYGYHYAPAARAAYSRDLKLADTAIRQQASPSVTLLVSPQDKPFYQVYANHLQRTPKVVVTSSVQVAKQQSEAGATLLVASREAGFTASVPDRIITTATAADAARFYVYKNPVL